MRRSTSRSLGAPLRALTIIHALLGVVIYRRELAGIAEDRLIGAVAHRSERAAALWFIGSALPGWTLGHLIDSAAGAGDRRAVRLAGMVGAGAGIGGALLMPRSLLWAQAVICADITRRAARLVPPQRQS